MEAVEKVKNNGDDEEQPIEPPPAEPEIIQKGEEPPPAEPEIIIKMLTEEDLKRSTQPPEDEDQDEN